MKLLLRFAAEGRQRSVDQLTIEDLTAPLVLEFLADLETRRRNSGRTRIARLAAVQTFFRYVASREPALARAFIPVLAIPGKITIRPVLVYMTEHVLVHLFDQVNLFGKRG